MTDRGSELIRINRGLGKSDFDMSLTYYLAGPMSGYPKYNHPKFEADEAVLTDAGIAIISPHRADLPDNYLKMSAESLWREMMSRTSMMLMMCHGIILIKGWPQSKGARAELQFALDHDWPVYYFDDYILTSMNREREADDQH